MIEYLKKEIKHIPFVLIVFVLFYSITTFATGGLLNSSSVLYDNSTSNIEATNVGDAIDELYTKSSNYAGYNQNLTALENDVGTNPFTTVAQTLTGAINEVYSKSNGIISIANGGTGVTTLEDIKTALDIPSTSDIPVYSTTSKTGKGFTASIYRYGNVVTINIYTGKASADISTSTTIMTIPEGYRPNTNAYATMLSNQNGSANTSVIRCAINASTGALTTSVALTSGKYLRGSVSYVAS